MTLSREMLECLPNFFLLGAMKSGTTTLYEGLRQSPGVTFGLAKEPQFFCVDELFCKGLEFYVERFYRDACGVAARGDATPHYLYLGHVAERIATSLPSSHCRFLVIFRNPVDRAYSHYWNSVNEGHEALSFEQALKEEKRRINDSSVPMAGIRFAYFSAGLYALQLQVYLERFPRSHFHFLLQDDLSDEGQNSINSVLSFLGVGERRVFDGTRATNPSARPRSTMLRDFLNNPSVAKRALGRFLPHDTKYRLARILQAWNRKPAAYPSMRTSTRENLLRAYAEDVSELERITGRDLSAWAVVSEERPRS